MDTVYHTPQDDNIPRKKCSICQEFFPANDTYFHRQKNGLYGLGTRCKECMKKYKKQYKDTNREKIKVQDEQYRQSHKEQIRQKNKAWYQENKEKAKARDNHYYQSHKEAKSKKAKIYYLENKERIDKRNAAYYLLHKEAWVEKGRIRRAVYADAIHLYMLQYRRSPRGRMMLRVMRNKRRARKLGASGSHTAQQLLEQKGRQKSRCYWCHAKLGNERSEWHEDHIIPLSRNGSNDISNIVIACPTCNLKRNNKLPHEWSEGGRLL